MGSRSLKKRPILDIISPNNPEGEWKRVDREGMRKMWVHGDSIERERDGDGTSTGKYISVD